MVQLKHDKDDLIAVRVKRRKPSEKHHKAKNNHSYIKSGKQKNSPNTNPRNSNHIVVKITGGARDKQAMKGHFEYITRNDELPLYDENCDIVDLRETIADTDIEMNTVKYKSDSRKTAQIVFSRKGSTDPNLLMQSVSETINQNFPNTKFYFSCHQDTDNTHVHVVLLRHNKNKKKHEIRKGKLVDIKRQFAKSLNSRGIAAEFYSETDKQQARNQKKEVENKEKKNKRKGANEYTILDFDKAPYKFENGGKPSFYIVVETKNKEIKTHWSLGIQAALKESNAKIGDKITLKQIKNVDTSEKNEDGRFKRSSWKIEVLDKTEVKKQNYQVVDFGKAPYKFDEKGKSSFYMIIQGENGLSRDLWGRSIEETLLKNGVKIGDWITGDIDNKEFIKASDKLISQISNDDKSKGFKL